MKVYMSIPVEMLDREQAGKLYGEMAALLAEHGHEGVSNPAALKLPEDDPKRVWKHLACAMLLMPDCQGVLFAPAYLDLRTKAPAAEFHAALGGGKRLMYTYRDADRKLALTPDSLAPRGMKYPEK